ncbi:High mobility group nucleosome-binding domain-containing protein 3 isoform X1 [Aix galericulata]|nr:High mobility group nucleosome-binding domain-containing protein 3 isoform X1 [Aix galericulata]
MGAWCNPELLARASRKEPGTKANKGAKGKKDEKQEAAKEGTTPSENGENKAEEIRISRSTVSVSTSRGAPPSTLSVKGQTETVKVKGTAQKTESVGRQRGGCGQLGAQHKAAGSGAELPGPESTD